ncbi:MAG: hypothetical protein HY303_18835 [Candidatus Wallbacteria bacterium]|nr:hypothetical protein [Candidatus Wallbacteria bacterium]
MPLLLTLLASGSLVAFGVALASGALGASFLPGFPHHLTLGMMAALLACTVHCAVFTYFLGTGLSIKEAVSTHGLEEALVEETKTMKKRAFPWVFNAIFAIVAAVIAGGFAMSHRLPPILHGILAAGAVAYSVYAFYREFAVIRDNVVLLNTLKKQLAKKAAAAEWPPEEADMSRVDQGRSLVFFGFSTAFAYVYLRYITRAATTPLLPFALVASLSTALGSMILKVEGRSR